MRLLCRKKKKAAKKISETEYDALSFILGGRGRGRGRRKRRSRRVESNKEKSGGAQGL